MIRHAQDNIISRSIVLFAKFIELFGASSKTVDQDDHVFCLHSMVIKLCNTHIPPEVLIVRFLHGLHASNSFS